MSDNFRHPSLIQEELFDLQKLLQENEILISKYPEKFSLKLSHQSLKDREESLFLELRTSSSRFQMDIFDYVLDGDIVDNHRISLSFFGDLMSILQDITSSIAQSLTGKTTIKGAIPADVLRASRLDLVAITGGSVRVILSSHEPQLNESSAKTSLRCFNDLIECGDNKTAIKELSSKLGKRVLMKYKDFLEMIYKNNATITMYDKSTSENFRSQKITSELAKKIYNVIIEVEKVPDISVEYRGVLKGISLLSNTFEFLIDDSHQIINGKFEDTLANEVLERLNIPINIKFKLTTTISDITYEEKKDWVLLEFTK